MQDGSDAQPVGENFADLERIQCASGERLIARELTPGDEDHVRVEHAVVSGKVAGNGGLEKTSCLEVRRQRR